MKSVSTQVRAALAVVAALLFALPAAATSFIMATDREMVDGAVAVIEARVLSSDYAPGAALPSTDYMIEVEEVLGGDVTGRNLIVRVPGGERPDGIGLYLAGMPEFVVGERALLFLSNRGDGTYGIHNLMLGAFHEVARGGQSVYIRGLEGAKDLVLPGLPDREPYYRLRSAEPFRRWIEATARGEERRAEYFIEAAAGLGSDGDVGSVTGQFRLFSDGANGLNIRWFNFDSGQSVDWRIEPGGQPGFNVNQTANAMRSGMAVWNNDSDSIVDYRYVGTTNSKKGFNGGLDGINALIYRNADNSIDSGNFTCNGNSASGTLALGGPFYCRPGSRINESPYNGMNCPAGAGAQFNAAFEAEIITNRGIECLFDILRGQPNGNQLAQRALEALLGHELGHTLGIGHSCTDGQVDAGTCPALQANALMYPFLHTDGRGAAANNDDRRAVRALYEGNNSAPVPQPPTNLTATLTGGTNVLLEWQDNSNDEAGFVIELSFGGSGFETLTTVGANTESLQLNGLLEDTLYGFRVRARNSGGTSVPSNEVEVETDPGIPSAPSGLAANTASATAAVLTWVDESETETDFIIEARTPQSGDWMLVKSGIVADPDISNVETTVEGLTTGVPYAFRVRARNLQGVSEPSNVDAATPATNPDGCTEDASTLCLLGDRFQVQVEWRNQHSAVPEVGVGMADELSDRSGTFWFFREDNIELIVKVLDGTAINEFYWTFYGALTDIEYWITVVDTEDGDSKTYYNAPGERCGQFDTASLPGDLPIEPQPLQALRIPVSAVSDAATAGTCVPDATTLCLLDDRFAVEVDWRNQRNGETGFGTAVPEPRSERTGYFWFFNAVNIELVVKALDGRPVNGYYWIFYGSLSDVEYTLTVTDTLDERTKTYTNAPFNQCGQFDNAAFLPSANE